jgi:catechol 2,3-dioxygenase-like lactoylglutathione lyase family enzyme
MTVGTSTRARGLDHVVHAVRDLDAARDLYQRLGFTVGARNRHPPAWGTENHIVQLPGFFVEPLAVADASGIAPHAPRSFSFGAFNRNFLAHDEGLSMLVLKSDDARADASAFRVAGVGDFDVFDFEREARRPDGGIVKVAFSLAFARDQRAPKIGFFSCQQHYPESFWNPAFQTHANTAKRIAAAILVADNPQEHDAFLTGFAGRRDVDATPAGISVRTPRGDIRVMDRAAFSGQFGVIPPDTGDGARLAALVFGVRDFPATVATLKDAKVAASVRMGRIIVPPAVAMGATIVFEQC